MMYMAFQKFSCWDSTTGGGGSRAASEEPVAAPSGGGMAGLSQEALWEKLSNSSEKKASRDLLYLHNSTMFNEYVNRSLQKTHSLLLFSLRYS